MTHGQLGFGFDEMAEEQRTAYLPSTMEEGIPFYRQLIERHQDAMMAGDIPEAMKIRHEAHDLAVKVNGGDAGICGGPDAPAYVLERATAATPGTVPLWGQTGTFTIDVDGMQVRIEQDGIFGTGSLYMPFPPFGAHAVDYEKPFISETGYRCFIGHRAEVEPGTAPDELARRVIKGHIAGELKGKLKKIEGSYVKKEMERRVQKRDGPRPRSSFV